MLARDKICPLLVNGAENRADSKCMGAGCGWFTGDEDLAQGDKIPKGKSVGRCAILDIGCALAGIHNVVVKSGRAEP